jgi:hypothetical protein
VLTDHFPGLGPPLSTARLQLRRPDPDELAALASLASAGTHEPAQTPFAAPRPTSRRPSWPARWCGSRGRCRGAWTRQRCVLPLVAFHSGHIVGLPELKATNVAVRPASIAVCRQGYEPDGVQRDMARGKRRVSRRLRLTRAAGGADLSRGRDMRSAHAHLNITAADWHATVGHLIATLQALGLTDDLIGEIASRVLPLRDVIVSARSS